MELTCRTTILLPTDLHAQLTALARDRKVSMGRTDPLGVQKAIWRGA